MRTLAFCAPIMALLLTGCAFLATPTAAPPATTPTARPTNTRTAIPTPTALPTASATATTIPTATPVPPVLARPLPAGSLVHPVSAAVAGDVLYVIDSGALKALDLRSPGLARTVSPASGAIDQHPIQELAAVAYASGSRTLYLLDRSGAVYGWDLAARWWLDRKPGGSSSAVQEYPVDLASDGDTVYLLDTNNGRIWKRSAQAWSGLITSTRLQGGLRLAVAGDVFVLVGERTGRPARLERVRGGAVSDVVVSGGLEQPSLLAATPQGLALVDREFARLRVLDASGAWRQALAGLQTNIYALAAGESISAFIGPDWLVTVRGVLPERAPVAQPPPARPANGPHDPATLARLPTWNMPFSGSHLPDIDRSLPGAPRPYRFGIHEGIDLYTSTAGVPVVKGTNVRAVAAGVVVRADVEYKEATAAQVEQWLQEAIAMRMTPAWIQDRLGGRQVWVDHGSGLSTRYLHLSGVAPGIQVGSAVSAGQVLAQAGNSGTPEAAAGYASDVHLHFEVRIGDGYLGQWISPIETRRILGRLFGDN